MKNLLRLIIAAYYMKKDVDAFNGGRYDTFMVSAHKALCAADALLLNLTPERNEIRRKVLEGKDL